MTQESARKVLIVDDSRTSQVLLGDVLEAEYQCFYAANGQQALEAVARHAPDAVVSDLEMPGMDGVALLRALRAEARTRALPVVIVSSVTAVDRVNACRSLGCAGYVLKPVQPEYLLAKLRSLLRQTRAAAS
jgi:CheY-like chemotaxis protein